MLVIEMVARTTFTHDGVTRTEGEHFSVPPIVAAALKYQRKAVFPQQYQRRDVVADAPPLKRRRRTYRRRDMVADQA